MYLKLLLIPSNRSGCREKLCMSMPKGIKELAITLEMCGGVYNKGGQLSQRSSDVVTRVSGDKSKEDKSHHFASILSNVSGRRASYPGNV